MIVFSLNDVYMMYIHRYIMTGPVVTYAMRKLNGSKGVRETGRLYRNALQIINK